MNNKLLKLCVAVALIAGAEDGVCARGGGTSSNRERVFERSETSVGVEAKVKALVNVEFGNQGQTLSLVGDDGSKDTKNNTYKFEVNSFAVGYALRFDLLDSQGNLRKDEDTVIENDDGDKLKIVGRLLDGKDKFQSLVSVAKFRLTRKSSLLGNGNLSLRLC